MAINGVFILVTWKQLQAARLQRLDSLLPVISVKSDPESVRRPNDGIEFDLIIQNDGVGPAICPEVQWLTRFKTSLDVRFSTAGLGPGQSETVRVKHPDFMMDWLGSIPGVLPSVPENQAPKVSIVQSGTIKVTYKDVNRRTLWTQVKVGVYVGGDGPDINPMVFDLTMQFP